MKRPLAGSILRSRKDQRRYHTYVSKHKIADCDFCEYNDSSEFQKEYERFLVIKNLFPYTIWDGMNVLDHLMVIPKRHVTSLGDFSDNESKDYIDIISDYEKSGYSAYTRSNNNNLKSVPHQHTHLIKTGSRHKRLMLFVRRPHVLIAR